MIPIDFVGVTLRCGTPAGESLELPLDDWHQTSDGPIFKFVTFENEIIGRELVMTLVTKEGVSEIKVGINDTVHCGSCMCHGMRVTVALTEPWVIRP